MITYTPNIVDNFWNQYNENKDLITRSFNYLYKKFPDYEGKKYSFNNLIIRIHELNVFYKFSLKKIAIKEKKENLINKVNLSRKDLIDAGVDISKCWEKFIFNWIQKILKERHYIVDLDHSRYIYNSSLFDYQENYNYWIESEYKKYNDSEKDTGKEENKSRRGKIYPPCFNNRLHPSEEYFDNQLDTLLAAETDELIIKNLTGKNEREVYSLLKQELCVKDICSILNLCKSRVNIIIRSIKKIVESNTTTF